MNSQWRAHSQHLPIVDHLEPIASALANCSVLVLKAPPGTGKTTILPLALLEQEFLKEQKILILQPRRLAARTVALRMSELLGERVGATVGYQVRLERVVSNATRIEIITEGILARKITSDPAMQGVGAIVFDEFHERSIHADVGLALALEVASCLRPDLKLVVMSATLADPTSIPALVGAQFYECHTRTHPVSVYYQPGELHLPLWERSAKSILQALQQHPEGDLLAFLPGVYEIQQTESILLSKGIRAAVLPLYGELPVGEQQRALLPDPHGRRKVVLSTPIAETSVTIDGVRIVIDSGYHKVSRCESVGSTLLKTERISRDSSEQRAGRAGRTAPGVCVRLWSEQEQRALREFREPEVLRADLSAAVLELAAWGVRDPHSFGWITPPPRAALDAACALLRRIGAIEDNGAISEIGARLAELGAHPLLGKLALTARYNGLEELAASLLALIEERDIVRSNASGADITARLRLLTTDQRNPRVVRALQLAERWKRRIKQIPHRAPSIANDTTGSLSSESNQVAFLLAQAFPLSIAQRREKDSARYLMASGRGCVLRDGDPLSQYEYLIVIELRESAADGRVVLAAPLDKRLFDGALSSLCDQQRLTIFDSARGQLQSVHRRMCGAIVLSESAGVAISAEAQQEALTSFLQSAEGFTKITFSPAAERLRLRAHFARTTLGASEVPDLSDDTLRASVATWLMPLLQPPYRLSSVEAAAVERGLHGLFTYSANQKLSELAPEHFVLPSGKTRLLEYTSDGRVILQATIQELFGVRETPRLGRAAVPLTIHLLSPAKRAMQVTQDLAGFWLSGYPAVRRELRGRYPKHPWPEDPTVALPGKPRATAAPEKKRTP
jgi:ATP-dependent helicase HrpB